MAGYRIKYPRCKERVPVSLLEEHKRRTCDGRSEPCSICGQEFENYLTHLSEECPGAVDVEGGHP